MLLSGRAQIQLGNSIPSFRFAGVTRGKSTLGLGTMATVEVPQGDSRHVNGVQVRCWPIFSEINPSRLAHTQLQQDLCSLLKFSIATQMHQHTSKADEDMTEPLQSKFALIAGLTALWERHTYSRAQCQPGDPARAPQAGLPAVLPP